MWYFSTIILVSRDKTHSETMKNTVEECHPSAENVVFVCGRSYRDDALHRNVLTDNDDDDDVAAYNFRARSRLTSSKTSKIYEKNACQHRMEFMKTLVSYPGPGINLPLLFHPCVPPLFTVLLSSSFLVHPFSSSRENLVRCCCCCMWKVYRLVMYLLRYIKLYIDVRIPAMATGRNIPGERYWLESVWGAFAKTRE